MRILIFVSVALATRALYADNLTLNQQLIVACYKVEVGKVVKCLRDGADVNARFGEIVDVDAYFMDRWTGGLANVAIASWTPLIALAASKEYPDAPAELGDIWNDLERSAQLMKKIPHEHIERRRADSMIILNILLSHKCNLEDNDGYGATAIYKAANHNNVSFVKSLLSFGANPNVKVGTYIDGPGNTTPLHRACNSWEMVQLLLDHGANPDVKDSDGDTPADWYGHGKAGKYEFVKTADGWQIRPRAQAEEKKK